MPIEKQVSPIEVRDLINENSEIYPIDIRSREDFEKSKLKGFINIPYPEISKRIPRIEPSHRVYLLCENGVLGADAQTLFEACGIQAFIIRGGLAAWKEVIDPSL